MSANLKKKPFQAFRIAALWISIGEYFCPMNSKVPKQRNKYLKSWHSGYKACTCQKSLCFAHSESDWQRGRWAQFWCRWSWDQLWEIWSKSIHLRALWVYTFSFSQTSISSIFKLPFSHSIYFWLVFWKGITCIK